MSDIRLVEDYVVVEGTLDVQGSDIKLANADRMNSANRAPYRRALVHSNDDTLTVNFGNDYLGVEINGGSEGIKLNGNVSISGAIEGPDIFLDKVDRRNSSNSSSSRRALVHGHEDQLVLNYGNDYLGVEINGGKSEGIKLNGNVLINSMNISEIINVLQETVQKLMENQDIMGERIKDLEIKAGLRPSRQIESFVDSHKDLFEQNKIRIPTSKKIRL